MKAVIAKSYERIHRSNLIGMGVLPLEFHPGEDTTTLGLTGEEQFSISGLADSAAKEVSVEAKKDNGQIIIRPESAVITATVVFCNTYCAN